MYSIKPWTVGGRKEGVQESYDEFQFDFHICLQPLLDLCQMVCQLSQHPVQKSLSTSIWARDKVVFFTFSLRLLKLSQPSFVVNENNLIYVPNDMQSVFQKPQLKRHSNCSDLSSSCVRAWLKIELHLFCTEFNNNLSPHVSCPLYFPCTNSFFFPKGSLNTECSALLLLRPPDAPLLLLLDDLPEALLHHPAGKPPRHPALLLLLLHLCELVPQGEAVCLSPRFFRDSPCLATFHMNCFVFCLGFLLVSQ